MKTIKAITTTTYRNEYTGYWFVSLTRGKPAVSTVKHHLRKSRAKGCRSTTVIAVDGIKHELLDRGNGMELVAVGG